MTNREIDALVAEKVLGWKRRADGSVYSPEGKRVDEWGPRFSTDIAAAWEVVEKLGAAFRLIRCVGGWRCTFDDTVWSDGPGAWDVQALHGDGEVFVHEAFAATAPLAICLAALQACGVLVE